MAIKEPLCPKCAFGVFHLATGQWGCKVNCVSEVCDGWYSCGGFALKAMAEETKLQDSGARREFPTGAVRDIAEGKGRCDLLPLKVLTWLTDQYGELEYIDTYVRKGHVEELICAVADFGQKHFGNLETALLETSKQFEAGAAKYSDRNWERGIDLHCFIDSAVRHYLKFKRGDTDEPHDRAFLWNLLCAIWTHENRPEMIDLPFKEG